MESITKRTFCKRQKKNKYNINLNYYYFLSTLSIILNQHICLILIIIIGESSHPTNPTRHIQRSQSVRYLDPSPLSAPSLYKSSVARQKNVKNLFKGGAIKETMGRLISKFFIYESVAPNKVDSHHFKNLIVGAQQADNYYNFKSCIHFNNIIIIYAV